VSATTKTLEALAISFVAEDSATGGEETLREASAAIARLVRFSAS